MPRPDMDSRAYGLGCEALDLAPEEIVFVDDQPRCPRVPKNPRSHVRIRLWDPGRLATDGDQLGGGRDSGLRCPIFGRGVPKTAIAPTTSSQNGTTPTPGIASRPAAPGPN